MLLWQVSTHSRPKAAGRFKRFFCFRKKVSTHSRPKAAGILSRCFSTHSVGFNTQPPEGGWAYPCLAVGFRLPVSTHSRPKAAGLTAYHRVVCCSVSTHSRPKAAGLSELLPASKQRFGFNTQPPEGGWAVTAATSTTARRFQHTAARRRLATCFLDDFFYFKFQHTAARRRLVSADGSGNITNLFQHTAARRRLVCEIPTATARSWFQHTAARRRLVPNNDNSNNWSSFQHTAARRRLDRAFAVKMFDNSMFQHTAARRRLGRPPSPVRLAFSGFNTQPPEGGWDILSSQRHHVAVSTHSRPKAAGWRVETANQ